VMRDAKWDMRPMIRTMLTSQAFYSQRAIGSQIKSPVQLVAGTIRQLDLKMPPPQRIEGALNQMGQVPMMPPNVKGWPGGRTWISTSTTFVRYNTAVFLAGGSMADIRLGGRGNKRVEARPVGKVAGSFQPDNKSGTPEQIVDSWVQRLIQRPIDESKRTVLIDAVGDEPSDSSVRNMIQLIVSMPDYQLC